MGKLLKKGVMLFWRSSGLLRSGASPAEAESTYRKKEDLLQNEKENFNLSKAKAHMPYGGSRRNL
ncbi:hypothetical protein COLO4_24452 [Corchorus olitorius]|uniref:Uncharacterized protein n=1 Tax=Corchorus olitorius TaxID=93759 RepID=A0A1R3I9X6_9ROSI|nr:hypothetical protein COLO4_24452 [Corchorus olitorius]